MRLRCTPGAAPSRGSATLRPNRGADGTAKCAADQEGPSIRSATAAGAQLPLIPIAARVQPEKRAGDRQALSIDMQPPKEMLSALRRLAGRGRFDSQPR